MSKSVNDDPLLREIRERVRISVPGVLVRTDEPHEVIQQLRRICHHPGYGWRLIVHNIDKGASVDVYETVSDRRERYRRSNTVFDETKPENMTEGWVSLPYAIQVDSNGVTESHQQGQPGAAGLRLLLDHVLPLSEAQPQIADEALGEMRTRETVVVLQNPRFYLSDPALVEKMTNLLLQSKSRPVTVILLSSVEQLVPELDKLLEPNRIRHKLPEKDELAQLMLEVCQSNGFEYTAESPEMQSAAKAASGLTRLGAEDAIALSLSRHGRICNDTIFEVKAAAMSDSQRGIKPKRPDVSLQNYGGAQFLKDFCVDLLSRESDDPLLRPKGIFLLGPPGSGKTFLASCIAGAVGRPLLEVTLGALKNRMQGASFENLQAMIETAERQAPAILLLDEIEGQLAGGKDTGATDGGTTSQMNSRLLSWLSEKQSDLFVICAANSVKSLMRDMPEFARLGRFDGMFFLDYPSPVAKREIWQLHLQRYGLIGKEAGKSFDDIVLPNDHMWTGAEIEACCRLARLRGKSVAQIGDVMPTIHSQATETIDELRGWAHGRCYDVEIERLYDANKSAKSGQATELATAAPRRKVRQR